MGKGMLNFIDPTTSSNEKATDSIEMRVKPSVKSGIVRAAELMGVPLTAFVRASATREAERILNAHQTTVLSKRDQRAVLAALDNPPQPTRAALDAAVRYRARIANAR